MISFTLWSILFYVLPVPTFAITQNLQKSIGNLWDHYWFYIAVFIGIGVLTGVLAFIVLFMRLGASGDKPQERSRIFREMIAVAICTSLLGAFTFIVTLYLALFN